jgi:transcriptional regulator with XRE-family HTH domain
MKEASFAELFEEAKKHDAYWVADAIYAFTKELHKLTETAKVSRTELARRLAVSPAYVTKIFRGDVNFTIDTMVRLARAIGGKVHLHVAPDEHEVRWFDVISPKRKVVPLLDSQFKKFKFDNLKEGQDGISAIAA